MEKEIERIVNFYLAWYILRTKNLVKKWNQEDHNDRLIGLSTRAYPRFARAAKYPVDENFLRGYLSNRFSLWQKEDANSYQFRQKTVGEMELFSLWNSMIVSSAPESVTGFRFSAVMDDKTTSICRERNGITLPKDDPFWLENRPPLHFGCRSVIIPVYEKF